MRVPSLEREIGIEVYGSSEKGVGGVIKQFPEDFIVEEILVNGAKAEIASRSSRIFADKGRYMVCVLVKRDWDTLLAMRRIAQKLGKSVDLVDFAGLKDTRALTTQHVSFAMTRPEEVAKLGLEGVELHPVGYSSEKIAPSMLFGNHFKIAIRAIRLSRASTVETRILNAKLQLEKIGGFPNFFGHQRFGTVRAVTHLVGKALLEGDFEKAVLTYLANPSPYEHPSYRKARLGLLESRDFETASRTFPSSLEYEHLLLRHLHRSRNDFSGALRAMPLRLRRLFVQAYQSYLFNRFLSRRLLHGLRLDELSVGDHVMLLDDQGLPTGKNAIATSQTVNALQRLVDERKACLGLPIMGFKQQLSSGLQGSLEQAVIDEEDVKPQDFLVESMPELRSTGGLRTACSHVFDFNITSITADSEDPSKLMVRLSFTLHRGCYATVVLREFMKPRNLVKAGF